MRAAIVAAGGVGLAACRSQGQEDTGSPNSPGPRASEPPSPSEAGAAGAPGVLFTVTGSAFRPLIELAPGSTAEVRWLDASGRVLATGVSPTLDLADGQQTVRMQTLLSDVLTVNVGFSSTDDAGEFSLEATHDKPPEPVTKIAGLPLLTNLRRLLAANTELNGSLDFSGLAHLEHIECFKAHLESVDLTGCDSLVRLCVEENSLMALDLNPVSSSLRDLRAAAQKSGRLDFASLDAPLSQLSHFCVRDQTVTGHPSGAELPVCEELWNWNAGQVDDVPTPGAARSVLCAGNAYTSAAFQGRWQFDGGGGVLDLTGNRLTSVNLLGCSALQTIRLGGNSLPQTMVDDVLAEVASWGTQGVELVLDGANHAPSAAGLEHASNLQDRGWHVTVTAS